CGDFNERLLEAADKEMPIIAIGRRLESKLQRKLVSMEGPNVAEEVESVLTNVVDYLAMLQGNLPENEALGITAFYHSDETGGVRKRRLLPLPEQQAESAYSHEPLLYLEPVQFYEKLSSLHLYAALHEALYSSLMVENRYRLDHMENAIRQMDKRIERLRQHYNLLRQEEITEEIEVIMLSVEALAQ
ncbi:MAG TPA: F0F1 ATP synthase subunit gamma, partial [Burkholderiales bacterium]|nr:F0F1 ATP synthase subunit gamma [Burkholderiales bacterium]